MQGRVRRLKIDTLKKAAIACKYEESPETAVVSGLHLWRSGRDSNSRSIPQIRWYVNTPKSS